MKSFFLMVAVSTFLSYTALGHGGHSTVEHRDHASEITTPSPFSKFGISADLRPSLGVSGASFFDNEIGLSYFFSPKISAAYNQRFQLTLKSTEAEHEEGPDFHEHHDGFLQFNIDDIASIGSAEVAYEARVFTPTSELKRNRGFITALANFAKVTIPISSWFSLCISEGPVLHSFSKSEYAGADEMVSNPLLENRFSMSFDFSLFSNKVRFSLPIFWHEFYHYSSQQNAKFAGQWSHAIWVSPEIVYKLSSTMNIGLSYHSENLLSDYSYTLGMLDGLSGGVFQLVYQVRL
jgi:hypothetical protein